MRIVFFKRILALFFLFSLNAFAQEPTPPQSQIEENTNPSSEEENMLNQTGEPVSYKAAFTKMMLSLLVLIILIVISVWMLRRISHGRMKQLNTGRSIKIIERRPLSAKSILYLIEVNGKKVVIAESQLEVRAITTAEEEMTEES